MLMLSIQNILETHYPILQTYINILDHWGKNIDWKTSILLIPPYFLEENEEILHKAKMMMDFIRTAIGPQGTQNNINTHGIGPRSSSVREDEKIQRRLARNRAKMALQSRMRAKYGIMDDVKVPTKNIRTITSDKYVSLPLLNNLRRYFQKYKM